MVKNDITSTFLGTDTIILTENEAGEMYLITAKYLQDIFDDWSLGDRCEFVPANDARVFFAAYNGKPINPYEYTNFETLLMHLGAGKHTAPGSAPVQKGKSYTVTIKETLVMPVTVETESAEDAVDLVRQGWKDSKYVLDSECFSDVEFEEAGTNE